MLILVTIAFVVLGLFFGFRWQRARSRKRLLNTALFPDEWEIMNRNVPIIDKLPSELRDNFEGKVSLFLDQVEFIGCDGLEVTQEMELTIAAQAALLVVNTDFWYETLRTILIYPGAFKSRQAQRDGFVVQEKDVIRAGESWDRGPVILSWTHSEVGARDDDDGQNVVFHEFAHQLDNLSGYTDGFPLLHRDQDYGKWQSVMQAGFERLLVDVKRGHKNAIDAYGATGPEEFFAVSVEVFFERPAALFEQEPALYEELSKLFKLDPIHWTN